MTSTLGYVIQTLDWRGMLVQIGYNPDYTSLNVTAHLEIETQEPARAPLPITETGYRSHFLAREIVEDAGGPSAYVLAWLEDASRRNGWAQIDAEARQYTLL